MSNLKTGSVCWTELSTTDLEGGKNFYSNLFGWEMAEMEMPGDMKYTMFRRAGTSEDETIGGMMQITEEMGDCPPNWLSYVAVENLDESVAKATELGATVIRPSTDVGMGIFAIIADPQGAVIALWQEKGE